MRELKYWFHHYELWDLRQVNYIYFSLFTALPGTVLEEAFYAEG